MKKLGLHYNKNNRANQPLQAINCYLRIKFIKHNLALPAQRLAYFMVTQSPISFENTEVAFAHKENKELKDAHFLFSLMNYPWLVKLGTQLTPWAISAGLPIKGLIRKTLFKQFVGGETLEEIIPVVKHMAEYNVQVILDYGVEGKEGESSYDHARDEFIRVINFAATQPNIPFMSVKVTGIARITLL